MKPLYEQLVQSYGDRLNFGIVDIDDASGMELAKDQKILEEGIPYIQMFPYVPKTSHALINNDTDRPYAF